MNGLVCKGSILLGSGCRRCRRCLEELNEMQQVARRKPKAYVAGFMHDNCGLIAFVRKRKPAWQAGKLNGIGGAIEDGETPLQAMIREWKEETGHDHSDWTLFVRLNLSGVEVHFFKSNVDTLPDLPTVNDSGEPLEVHHYLDLVDQDVITNLRWLLPLAFVDNDNLIVEAKAVA